MSTRDEWFSVQKVDLVEHPSGIHLKDKVWFPELEDFWEVTLVQHFLAHESVPAFTKLSFWVTREAYKAIAEKPGWVIVKE